MNILHSQYIFNTITADKGLPSNAVRTMLQDDAGFMWIGTGNGLCRFDGTEYVWFRHDPSDSTSICDNEVKTIMQDHEGRIWIGTGRGISNFMPSEGKFSHYHQTSPDKNAPSREKIKYLLEDQFHNIIIGPDAMGIDMYDRKTGVFTNYLPSEQIDAKPARFVNTLICYEPDPHDSTVIWFGSQLGVLQLNVLSKTWKHIPLKKENAENPSLFTTKENLVRGIAVDKDGKLWLGTWGSGLCLLDPNTGRFRIFKYEELEPVNGYRNNINGVLWKSPEELWILAEHKGVAVFNIREERFRFLTNPDSGEIISFNPSALFTDTEGFLWISSFSKGVFYTHLDAHQFKKTGIPGTVMNIIPDPYDDQVLNLSCVNQQGGNMVQLKTTDNSYLEYNYLPVINLPDRYFTAFIQSPERLWLLESYALYYWDEKNRRIIHYPAFNTQNFEEVNKNEVSYLISGCSSPTGEIWLGTTFDGIFRLNLETMSFKHYYYPDEQSGSIYFQNFVFSLFADSRSRIWYGMTEFGYFDPLTERFRNFNLVLDFPDSPVKTESFRVISETPDGNIWLGTENNGILVINPNEPVSFVTSYNESNGLMGTRIRDLLTDKNGIVWAITDKCLNRINISTGEIFNYDEKYGLTKLNKAALISSGEIYLSASGGVYHFYPDSISPVKAQVKPYIKTFKIFDRSIDISRNSGPGTEIRLKHTENFFSIEYGAINYFNPEETEFCYMLEGQDLDWVSAGKRKYVSYTNLPGGNYNFRLRVMVKDEIRSEISLPLFAETPFWKTTLFYVILVLLVSAFVYALIKYRTNRIKKEEALKTRYNTMINELEMKALRAQMNPHFLFNSLNSIRYYVLQEEFENATGYITKFSKLLRLILHNSRQNQITLAEELEMVSIYIEFEQMRYDNSFLYEEVMDQTLNPAEIMIQPMTIQPFLENAIWHGLMPKESDRQLKLELAKDKGMLRITIEDNGVGREASSRQRSNSDLAGTKSYGLQIIRERFEVLANMRGKRSDFEIIDLKDSENNPTGTRVNIYYEI
ncbi:MAG: histidine kinase [Bacteroidales bacterium]|nr:histidine kinase [Bacteroidales bacterium]